LSCEPAWEENEEAIDAEFAKISDKIQWAVLPLRSGYVCSDTNQTAALPSMHPHQNHGHCSIIANQAHIHKNIREQSSTWTQLIGPSIRSICTRVPNRISGA
jgi:hypothetical protein